MWRPAGAGGNKRPLRVWANNAVCQKALFLLEVLSHLGRDRDDARGALRDARGRLGAGTVRGRGVQPDGVGGRFSVLSPVGHIEPRIWDETVAMLDGWEKADPHAPGPCASICSASTQRTSTRLSWKALA